MLSQSEAKNQIYHQKEMYDVEYMLFIFQQIHELGGAKQVDIDQKRLAKRKLVLCLIEMFLLQV